MVKSGRWHRYNRPIRRLDDVMIFYFYNHCNHAMIVIKFCCLHFYFQSEWLEGNQLMRQQIFVLPKVEQAPGLGSVGVCASPEAKGLIMDMLVWNPEKRKTSEQVELKL